MPKTLYFNRRQHCVHECACGTVHICGDYDRCVIEDSATYPYICPTCDQEMLDQILSSLNPNRSLTHEKHGHLPR
jgi:hypothetical protein